MAEVDLGLAWAHLLRGEEAPAEARIRAAIALAPRDPVLHENLVDLLVARGRSADAAVARSEEAQQAGQSP